VLNVACVIIRIQLLLLRMEALQRFGLKGPQKLYLKDWQMS